MRLKEQRLWDRMRNNHPANIMLQRVENAVVDGFPDVIAKHISVRGLWACELKAVDALPKRPTSRVFGDEGLNQDQKNWFINWRNFNGDGLIICSVGQAHQAFHWALDCKHADKFNDMFKAELDYNCICSGLGHTFWPRLWAHMGTEAAR